MSGRTPKARPGRPAATSRIDLERVGLELFNQKGFAATTVDDIAAAAGISRRTFFRYYPSKNDLVWGDFDTLLDRLETWLASTPSDVGLVAALTDAVVRFNALPPEAVASHRQRMALILHVPALQAHSTLRYAEWRGVVARFAAGRLALPADALLPQLVGYVSLGAAVAAYELWLARESADLATLLNAAFGALELRLQPASAQ
jgi:mycofactocin system transcriptional regulator